MRMSLDLQVFGEKPKYQTNQNFDMIMTTMKGQGITKEITSDPLGEKNFYTIFQSNAQMSTS